MAPSARQSLAERWVANSSICADHVAAGSFETAMKLLNRQIGVVNFAPLKPAFMAVYTGARGACPGLPGTDALSGPLQRNDGEGVPRKDSLPTVAIQLSDLVKRLRAAYAAFKNGKFADALTTFRGIMYGIPLLVVERPEMKEVRELLGICREYVTALRLELARRACAKSDAKRATELAAYMTHCNLQPAHMVLCLNLAMTAAFNLKNFINAASFARRLLEMPETTSERNRKLRGKARKVLTISEKQGRNAHKLDYDERNPFVVCAQDLKPIYKGTPFERSSYSGSPAAKEHSGKVCQNDLISVVGLETLGLVCSAERASRR